MASREIHRRALGCDKSSTALTNEEFDKVKAAFLAISRPDDLDAQIRQLNQARKRLLYRITQEQTSLLAVLLPGETPDDRRRHAERYVIQVSRDKFGTEDLLLISSDRHERGRAGDKSDLELLRDTLDTRINSLRHVLLTPCQRARFFGQFLQSIQL